MAWHSYRTALLSLISMATVTARSKGFLAVISIATMLIVYWEFWHGHERESFGTVILSSPEVFTRERLVNDRFREASWLDGQLKKSDSLDTEVTAYLTNDRSMTGSAAFDTSLPTKETSGTAAMPMAPPTSRLHSIEDSASNRPHIAQRDRLKDIVDYREQVRALLIENQLDDRHDLNGMSLFRLKFDATVLPGNNTHSPALIRVSVKPHVRGRDQSLVDMQKSPSPGANILANDRLNAWRPVYTAWLENLEQRLNQTLLDFKDGFANNRMYHNEYVGLMQALAENDNIPLSAVPACNAVTDFETGGVASLRLDISAHSKHKSCIRAIVAAYQAHNPRSPMGQFKGAYLESDASALGQTTPSAPLQEVPSLERLLDWELDRQLNAYFASKTLKLVLGITADSKVFFQQKPLGVDTVAPFNRSAFAQLINLTFFSFTWPSDTAITGSEAVSFQVRPKNYPVTAIDPGLISPAAFGKTVPNATPTPLSPLPDPLAGSKYDDFRSYDVLKPLLASERDVRSAGMSDSDIVLTRRDFRPLDYKKGVYSAQAEMGLVRFAEQLQSHTHSFTYSEAPNETGDTFDIAATTQDSENASASLPSTSQPLSLQMQAKSDSSSRVLERRALVVGFGDSDAVGEAAMFGWIINPRILDSAAQRAVFRQGSAKYSVSANVSVPSWWSKLEVTVEAGWLDHNGRFAREGYWKSSAPYIIDIPVDFEGLESTLLGEEVAPELVESLLDRILLVDGEKGAILIPGRRLWRSTVVTLGTQVADEIEVLPNMKGIIAMFRPVYAQASVKEYLDSCSKPNGQLQVERVVRVWTSQGMVALPYPATIGIAGSCPDKRQQDSKAKTITSGTKS